MKNTKNIIILVVGALIVMVILFYLNKNKDEKIISEKQTFTEETNTQNSQIENQIPNTNKPITTPQNTSSVFTVGENYKIRFSKINDADILWTYCYETKDDWVFTDDWESFDPCKGLETSIKQVQIEKYNFFVKKSLETSLEMVKDLNSKYGVEILRGSESSVYIEIKIPENSMYNSYTLAKIYFDTGYFQLVEVGSRERIRLND